MPRTYYDENGEEFDSKEQASDLGSFPLFEQAFARESDPWTSHEAAVKAGKGSRLLFRKIMRVETLADQALTMEQIGAALRDRGVKDSFSAIRSRICDLERAGMLEVVDSLGRTGLGNPCRRFKMSERGTRFFEIDDFSEA